MSIFVFCFSANGTLRMNKRTKMSGKMSFHSISQSPKVKPSPHENRQSCREFRNMCDEKAPLASVEASVDDDPLSPINVLEYLRSPPPRSMPSFPEVKVKTTILQGVRTRSPSPTPPSYPGFSDKPGHSSLMGTYLGDCVKYPSNRNYGSHLTRTQPNGLPTGLLQPTPRKPVRPTSLQEPGFCLSCPPNRLGFTAALENKVPDLVEEVGTREVQITKKIGSGVP